MTHKPPETFDLGGFARALIIALIKAETDPAEKMARIAIAQKDGHLTDSEAADLRG